MRAAVAIPLVCVPAAICMVLLRLGDVDWRQCFDALGDAAVRSQPLYPSFDAAITDIWQSVLRDLSSLTVIAQLFGPFVGFGLVHAIARAPIVRRANLFALGIWTTVFFYMLSDLSAGQDCDRKGNDAIFWFFVFAPVGLLISGLAAFAATSHHKRNPTSISDP